MIVPDEVNKESSSNIRISKAAIGAAIVVGATGALVIGPITGAVLAAGAVYATSKKGKVGEMSRKAGSEAYEGIEKGTRKAVAWSAKQIRKLENIDNDNQRKI